MLTIKTIVKSDHYSIAEDATVERAVKTMNKNGRGVVVVLQDNKPVGILTERDIVRILYKGNAMKEKAYSFAYKTPITIREDRAIHFALNILIDNNIRRVIVVDRNGKFTGIVNQEDLVTYLEKDIGRGNLKVFNIFSGSRKLIAVQSRASIHDAMKIMVKNSISAVLVKAERDIVGIITEKDILKLLDKKVKLSETVEKFMSSPVISVQVESLLKDVVQVLSKNNIRRVLIVGKNGKPVGIVTERDILRNIEGSYSRFLENKVKSAKDLLNHIPEIIVDVVKLGKENVIQWCNDKAKQEFGENLIDKPISLLMPQGNWKHFTKMLSKNNVEKTPIKVGDKYFEISGYYLQPDDKSTIQVILKDVTYQVKLSIKDHLTGLYNRRYTEEFLKKGYESSRRYKHHLSVAMIDIDDFKRVNDIYGHEAGDQVLKTLARIFHDNIRKADVIGRYGGEEFIIIMPKAAKENAYIIMEKFRKTIEKENFKFNKKIVRITASFGISSYTEDTRDIQELLAIADLRLYRAKREGKNRVIVADV